MQTWVYIINASTPPPPSDWLAECGCGSLFWKTLQPFTYWFSSCNFSDQQNNLYFVWLTPTVSSLLQEKGSCKLKANSGVSCLPERGDNTIGKRFPTNGRSFLPLAFSRVPMMRNSLLLGWKEVKTKEKRNCLVREVQWNLKNKPCGIPLPSFLP